MSYAKALLLNKVNACKFYATIPYTFILFIEMGRLQQQ